MHWSTGPSIMRNKVFFVNFMTWSLFQLIYILFKQENEPIKKQFWPIWSLISWPVNKRIKLDGYHTLLSNTAILTTNGYVCVKHLNHFIAFLGNNTLSLFTLKMIIAKWFRLHGMEAEWTWIVESFCNFIACMMDWFVKLIFCTKSN